jgi:hypothetical protein
MARQSYICFKNIYHVGSIFIASVTVEVFETDRKLAAACAPCFTSYQLAPSPARQQLASVLVTNMHTAVILEKLVVPQAVTTVRP